MGRQKRDFERSDGGRSHDNILLLAEVFVLTEKNGQLLRRCQVHIEPAQKY